jgi:hypothetical protein
VNRLYAYGLLAALILGSLCWHLYGDHRVKVELAETKIELELATTKIATLEASLLQVTNEKTALDAKATTARQTTLNLQKQLSVKIAELRKVPAPPTCEDQVPWLYEGAK